MKGVDAFRLAVAKATNWKEVATGSFDACSYDNISKPSNINDYMVGGGNGGNGGDFEYAPALSDDEKDAGAAPNPVDGNICQAVGDTGSCTRLPFEANNIIHYLCACS